VEVRSADARTLPFEDASIDVVVSSIVIHNIKGKRARQRALEEMVRVLRPGGRMAIIDIMGTRAYKKAIVRAGMEDVRRTLTPPLFIPGAARVTALKPRQQQPAPTNDRRGGVQEVGGSPSSRAGLLRTLARPLVLALVVTAVVWMNLRLNLPKRASVEGMRELAQSHPSDGPLLFKGLVLLAIFSRIPMIATVLIAVGGIVFGGSAALAYGWLASVVGTTGTFLVARFVARGYVLRLTGRLARFRALDQALARHGFWTVSGLRATLGLAPPLNWGLGLTGVRSRDYVAGTALGLIPSIAAIVFFADSIVNHPQRRGVLLFTGALGVMLLAAVVATAWAFRRQRRAATNDMESPLTSI
jgi:uncharacterized membrane protein YdjX (TVP38/TMEM64 family)